MSENIVSLRGGPVSIEGEKPCETLIGALTDLLERAQRGELRGIAATLSGRDGGVGFCLAGGLPFYTTMGAIEHLKVEFLDATEAAIGEE